MTISIVDLLLVFIIFIQNAIWRKKYHYLEIKLNDSIDRTNNNFKILTNDIRSKFKSISASSTKTNKKINKLQIKPDYDD